MFRLYLTRLILPFLFVVGMMAIPFIWLPDFGPPEEGAAISSRAGAPVPRAGAPAPPAGEKGRARPTPPPFQRAMTLGFLLILISVTAGGVMLYGITRRQTASWRRRFAPRPQKERPPRTPPPPADEPE
ncbi:MAG: hypothetical protein V3V62_13735 [bacterium]